MNTHARRRTRGPFDRGRSRTHVKQKADALQANVRCRLSVHCWQAVSPQFSWSTAHKSNTPFLCSTLVLRLPRYEFVCTHTDNSCKDLELLQIHRRPVAMTIITVTLPVDPGLVSKPVSLDDVSNTVR